MCRPPFHKGAIVRYLIGTLAENNYVEGQEIIYPKYLKSRVTHRCQSGHRVEDVMMHGTMDMILLAALAKLLFRARAGIA
jgi:hypothetical protein